LEANKFLASFEPAKTKTTLLNQLYLEAISEGFILGFGLAFLIGPAFFALLHASIDHGFGVSVALALGVVVSDCLLMTLTYFLLTPLTGIPYFHEGLGVVGGLVLIVTGFTSIVNKPNANNETPISIWDVWHIFRKGFSINTFNPFPWMFWLSTSALVSAGVGKDSGFAAFLFFGTAALTVFATDALKAWGAQFIIRYLSQKVLKAFRIISGLCLIAFGFRLLWFAFEESQKGM